MAQEIKNDDEIFFGNESNLTGLVKYKCEDCRNRFVTKNKINNCIICNSSRFSEEENIENLDSLQVLPFTKSMEEAIKNYTKKITFNPFIPWTFKKKNIRNSIKKVYIKNTIVSLKISGETIFLGMDKNNINKNESNKRKYKVVLKSNFDYEDVLVNNISKVEDRMFDEINNYNLSSLTDYNSSFLDSDIYILDNEYNEEKIKNRAMKCSLNVIKDTVKHDMKKLDKSTLAAEVNSKKDVLIPMYILNVKYKEKDYFYLMNGVNGNCTIDFPIGKLELILFSIVIFLIIFLMAFLVAYFL